MSINSESVSYDTVIKKYLETNKPVVHILTPCYGSSCFVNYISCIMATKELALFKWKLSTENNLLILENEKYGIYNLFGIEMTNDTISIDFKLPVVGSKKYRYRKL